jgi:superfamily II DNA/RNA helicase
MALEVVLQPPGLSQWRLKKEKLEQPLLQRLLGGMPDTHRKLIKAQFNDPKAPLRLLLATDAASEGLNFQRSCRYVFHQDIPWNPMRLEQRNGRVDRHGQRRETFVFHFTSTQQADLRFLGHVAGNVEQVREDLGSVGQVIDASVEENFTRRAVDIEELDQRLETFRDSAAAATSGRDAGSEEQYERAYQTFRAAEIEFGLTPERMARVLSLALQHGQGALQAEESPDVSQTYRLRSWPATWETLVDETVRIQRGPSASALPRLVFDPTYFEEIVDGRRVFTPRPNEAQLIRLGHPLMRRAVSHFRRSLWEKDVGGPAGP